MGKTPRVGRRDFLKMCVVGAGATLATGCRSAELGLVPDPGMDLATAAQLAYRRSLRALTRTVPLPDGTEQSLIGSGTLTSDHALLRAARGSRPGRADFDVLIIGSGYGGAVCAARLAARRRPGVRIALLERGREWVPGTFPQHLFSFNPLTPFVRRTAWMTEQHPYNPLGLFGFYDGDVQVVIGNGLGGASLTNCAVVLEPEEDVFRQAAWPGELRAKRALAPYYARAQRMLSPQTTPADRLTPKLRNHLATAARLKTERVWDAEAYKAPLAITFDARTNDQGVRQHGCVQCGDCVTGCNVGAKNSVDLNYLPLAWAHGAEMFTRVEVEHVDRMDGLHRIHYLHRPDNAREERGWLTARVLILAAGTLGTTGILLRS